MDAQELRNLQEAYMEVVENQQQLNEGYKPLPTDRIKKKTSRLAKDTLRDAGTALNPFKSASEKSAAKSNMEKRQKRVDKMVDVLKDKTQKEAYKPLPKGKVDKKMASKAVKAAKHQLAATWGDPKKSSENQEKANKLGSQAKHMAQISTETNKEANSRRRGIQSKHRSEVKRKIRYMDDIARQQRERGYGGSAIKKEEVDIYDIILSHLLDEGYAETPEAAEVIMVNMSEEWRQSIIG